MIKKDARVSAEITLLAKLNLFLKEKLTYIPNFLREIKYVSQFFLSVIKYVSPIFWGQ